MSDADDLISALSAPAPDAAPAPVAPAGGSSDADDVMKALSQPDAPAPAGGGDGAKKPSVPWEKLPYAQKVSQIESGGDPNAHAKTGTAAGLGQFTDDTWLPLVKKHRPDLAQGKTDAEISAMKTDPALNEEMIDNLGNENAAKLQQRGIPVNDASKYGAHWFGADGFDKIYHADPSTPIENIVGQDTAANNGLTGKSAGDVKTLTANKMHMNYMPQNLSVGDTLEQAGENLLPSAGRAASGFLHAAMHPGETAEAMYHIGKGLYSKLDGLNGTPQDPKQKAEDEALVDAMGATYKQDYGSIDGFKQKLANDPAGVLMDATTLYAGGTGAAGVAGKAIGRVGETVGRVSPAAGAAMQGVGDTLAGVGKGVFDSAGNITPKVDSLIQKATNGAMSGKDLVDPQVRRAFAQSIQAKGLSEATVKEALMKSQGLEVPTQLITGKGAPHEAKDKVRDAISGNNDKLDEATSKLFPGPSPTGIAEALDDAHTQSYNKAGGMYNSIRNMPGSFGARMPNMADLGTAIKSNFAKSGIPAADMKTLTATGHPQAAQAVQLLGTKWGAGKTLMQGNKGFTAPEVLAMRKALNNFTSNATGQDLKAMHDITNAFDQHIANQSALGAFRDASGKPVQGLGQTIKAANTAYRNHFNTFETPNGANNTIVSTIRKLKSGQGRTPGGDLRPSGDSDLYTSAQAGLARDLMHPQKGQAVYNQLTKALGGNTTAVDDFVKNTIMNGDKPVKNAGAMLSDPNSVAAKAFAGSPQDLSAAKHLTAARDINNAKALPTIGKSGLRNIMGGLARKGAFGLAGYETLGPAGLVVGPMAEAGYEHLRDARIQTKAMAGAPKAANPLGTLGKTIQRGYYADKARNEDQTISRASGGKVDMETLVTRLMNLSKKAKKDTDATTKPLLHVPDESIVHALKIAQEHI